jgi:CheY-like chemotaxis protein
MNTILGIAEIGLNNPSATPESVEAFGQICDAGELLLALVNDILDLTKAEAGKVQLSENTYTLPTLINDAAHLNHMRFTGKSVRFKIDFAEENLRELRGDDIKIKQILGNVLSNSFKYTEKGEVELSVITECPYGMVVDADAFLVISVRDTGQGMTEKQARECFEDFTRFNPELNRGTEGTGLGMGITKNFVEAMGGTLELKSKPGIGTAVSVRIPQKINCTEQCGAEIADKLRSLDFKSTTRKRKIEVKPSKLSHGRVLVVDDIQINLQVAKGFMQPYGVKIDTALSGAEALEKVAAAKAEKAEYDIIFMDHMMPGMDGVETTAILRKFGYSKPIVALTANAILGQRERFLESGFDEFISKPIDSKLLDAVFNKFVLPTQSDTVEERTKWGQSEHIVALGVSEIHKYFAKDAEHAVKVFDDFLDEREPTQSDFNNFAVSAHGMKGALIILDEIDLSEKAATLEKAGKAHDMVTIRAETPSLIKILREMIADFSENDESLDVIEEIAVNAEFEQSGKAELTEKLVQIEEACEHFNSTTALAALADSKAMVLPFAVRKAMDEIDLHLLQSDFESAAAAARALQESLVAVG